MGRLSPPTSTRRSAGRLTPSARATHVAATTPQGRAIEVALQYLVHLRRANYPDAPDKLLRAFGFLRESN